jgi:hypothetical protein
MVSLTHYKNKNNPFSLSCRKLFYLKKLFLLFSLFFATTFSFAQDSCNLRISLLTCAPGAELYATFGHTALRVQNATAGTDLVFNYGTFEFGPDFYIKFIRGKLLYFLSVEDFNDFVYLYQLDSRSIQEQVLQLSCEEKEKLFSALQVNAQEENKYYRYDFLFDNCTTRAGDIVANNTNSPVLFKNILPAHVPTFRDLIHSYLDAGHQYWSKLGIDILLGVRVDRKVSNREAMFLPEYLLKGFDNAVINNKPLVSTPKTILEMDSPLGDKSFFTPAIVFSLLLLAILSISLSNQQWATAVVKTFDFIFFFILGLAGMLILFMWFGTDHKVCQDNYSLLWALPSHLVMAFFVNSKRQWPKKYFKIIFLLTIALVITWFFLPQQMNNALIPILLLIIYRSWQLSKK